MHKATEKQGHCWLFPLYLFIAGFLKEAQKGIRKITHFNHAFSFRRVLLIAHVSDTHLNTVGGPL